MRNLLAALVSVFSLLIVASCEGDAEPAVAQGPRSELVRVDATQVQTLVVPLGGALPTQTIFLNREPVVVTRSFSDNSSNNTSTIVSGTRNLSGFSGNDEEWAEVMACVRND